ncbi:MAG TPA: heavy metal sensor histidine kinase [Gemmataceae bacterium]|jgi:heavy metal sensor kinase
MRLSIRWRLTLWNTLALAVVLLSFSALVYLLLRRALYEQIDRALLAEHAQLVHDERLTEQPTQRLQHWIDEFQEHEKYFCVIYDRAGQVVLATPELAADSIPPSPPPTGETHFRTRSLPIVGRQRELAAPLRAGGEDLLVVHLAPLGEVDRELQELLVVLGTAVPIALVLSGGLAYLLARQALAPVQQLHRQTAHITADRLDRRLPVANANDELGRLAQTINDMIARLERSFAEIRRFTADASHELRTPLTALRTEVEAALSKPTEMTDHANLLGSILEECDRLTRLTEQLLALAREDARRVEQSYQPLDLAALVRGVVETMRCLAEMKSLRLRQYGEDMVPAHGDAARLRQVFYNLLDNAIKYTPENGEIEVRLERRGGEAMVVLRDSGLGISAEHLPHVFERFYRVDKGRSRAEGGTGLGLSIAHSIVTAHGGRIELDSAPGRGTVCTVALPLDPATVNGAAVYER